MSVAIIMHRALNDGRITIYTCEYIDTFANIAPVACRGGADGATAPGIQPERGIQTPSFLKKKKRNYGKQLKRRSSEILGEIGKFVEKRRFSSGKKEILGICSAPGIQEPRWPRASKNLYTPPHSTTKYHR